MKQVLIAEKTKKQTIVFQAQFDTLPRCGQQIVFPNNDGLSYIYEVLKVEDSSGGKPWVEVKLIGPANQAKLPPTSQPTPENDVKKKTGAVPNTQSSAHVEIPTGSLDERIDYHFGEAIRYCNEAAKDEQMSSVYERIRSTLRRSSLLKAKLTGENLNRAQEAVLEKKLRWLPVLRRKFGKERNGQNFMEIARRWHELEPELERNPDLSIDGALRFLRKKDKWPWPREGDEELKKRKEILHGAKRTLQHVWPVWSSEEIEILYADFVWTLGGLQDEFEDGLLGVMNKLRWRVRLENRRRIIQRDGIRKRFTPFFTDEELRRHDLNSKTPSLRCNETIRSRR